MELLTPRQVQFVMPSTREVYLGWLAKTVAKGIITDDDFVTTRLKRDVEVLPDGKSAILWLGDRTRATKFVLFLHGGGYILPLDMGHMSWCMNAYIRAGQETGKEVAVAILQYSLCPAECYPTQLFQAADALGTLLDRGISPADIVLGGDSCGGHLAAGLLGHLLHSHPGVRKIELSRPLAGVFLVSPWLSTTSTGSAFDENKYLDMVSSKIVRTSSRLTLRGRSHVAEEREGQGWAMPGEVDVSWYEGLDALISKVYITAGKNEVLRDEVVRFAKTVRQSNPELDVKLEVRPKDAHDFILIEGDLNTAGDATKNMSAWYKSVLGSENKRRQ